MSGTTLAPVPDSERLPPVPPGLLAHWGVWLGAGPEHLDRLGGPVDDGPRVTVVGSPLREQPGWDGEPHLVAGVVDPRGRVVVSLPPALAPEVQRRLGPSATVADVQVAVRAVLAEPGQEVYRAVYRWAVDVPGAATLPPVGVWLPVDDDRVPAWLRPFRGPALVALDGDRYLAGVGLKRHDAHAHEIAVGTDEEARGRGLARRLVAQAARELLAAGLVPTYLHDPENVASARVAVAAGLPDRGWTVLGLG